jgi:hypothetical protein
MVCQPRISNACPIVASCVLKSRRQAGLNAGSFTQGNAVHGLGLVDKLGSTIVTSERVAEVSDRENAWHHPDRCGFASSGW